MSFQDIIKTIEKETEDKKKIMDKERKEKISSLEEEYARKIENKKEKILKNVGEKTERKIFEAAWMAREKRKISTLKKKRKLIEKIYENAFEKILNLSESEQRKFFGKLLDCIEEMKSTEIEIIPARKSKEIIGEIIKSKDRLKISDGYINSQGGFVAKIDDAEINCGFEMIFDKIRKQTELKVADRLFSFSGDKAK